jgi:cytidyltransferase-like protein
MEKKVFVSGCFDLLHSGHIAFLKEASRFGKVYVSIGSDSTIYDLKGRYPVNSQEERRYMLEAVKYVHECRIGQGEGIMDFEQDFLQIKPDIFVVNEDGDSFRKKDLCKAHQTEYKVLKRIPEKDLPARSTTALRKETEFPYRIDLSGGWLDQPYVSKYGSGPVVVFSIEPTIEFNLRSGMATSSRNKALEVWGGKVPNGDAVKNAQILFALENFPGKEEISGSQDHLGLLLPGINYLYYSGEYWPSRIDSMHEEEVLHFLEDAIYMVPLSPRSSGYSVLENTQISEEAVKDLASASESVWESLKEKSIQKLGAAVRQSFEAQIRMFPNMIEPEISKVINNYRDTALGYKLSGAGGGGYLILISDQEVPGAIRVKIRRKNDL